MKNVWYKVHKNTKEHEILCEEAVVAINKGFCVSLFGYDLVKADAEGWIEWKGGAECPVPDNSDYRYQLITGSRHTGRTPQLLTCTQVASYRPILNAEEKEMKQEWNGEGLPPIGTVCEVSHPNGRWIEGEIAYHTKNGAAAIIELTKGGWESGWSECFRPIRTDRDRWIEAAMEAASCPDTAPLIRSYFEAIYDAGLAKLPEQK